MTTLPPLEPTQFYRLPVVAQYMGEANVETVRQMLNTGELRGKKLGNGATSPWIVRGSWINEWAERDTYKPAA